MAMSEKREERPHPLANYPAPPPRGVDLPYDDGEPMESQQHVKQMVLLIASLDHGWRSRKDFFVGGNMFMYFSETQSRKNDFRGPDVFVVLDVPRHKNPERRSWVLWEEDGKAPTVIIELLSPSTEATDRGEKMRLYAKVLRVPAYFLYDPLTQVFEGYRLDPQRLEYERIEPDSRGYVRCEPLGLWLGVVPGTFLSLEMPWLRWIDDDGVVFEAADEVGARKVEALDRELAARDRELAARDQELAARDRELEDAQRALAEARRQAELQAERTKALEEELRELTGQRGPK